MYMTQCLHRTLQQNPEHLATLYGERRHTYRQFVERVARLAGALQRLGMAPGDRVGMLAHNSDRYLEYLFAVWWGGGVVNPVNCRWNVAEIVYSLDDCATGILLIDEAFAAAADDIRLMARTQPLFIYAGDGDVPAGMHGFERLIANSPAVEDAGRGGDDLACIMYTGGTTGFPKGVMQSHLNLWSACMPRMVDMPPIAGGRLLHVAPLFHVAGMARALIQFLAGESHVLVASFDAEHTLQVIERERITETLLVPSMILALLAHPHFDRYYLGSLKRLTYGASPSAGEMVEQLLARLPDIELSHSYGLTEACPVVSSNLPCNHRPEARVSGLSRSVGRGGLGVQVKIVDPQGREVPRGTVGEIIVRGPNIMQGYWNKPEETANALREGWLYTGDAAYMDEQGYLFIVDRLKDMIVSGGENIYSAEVENVLARHPSVAQCAVIGVPHPQWGEAVHAVVVRNPGAQVDAAQLRAHCRQFIARYKCPKTVEFREQLPLSAAGKVLKRVLRERYGAGAAAPAN
ncbi:long-chain fatty acid--CoA ligase [Pseudomonas sp. Hg5Tf]|uniref:Long-chain fatty acid--CoA ligase n=1 Tax=Pseudomonas sp. Hg7Tf TaxID=3236988 RepID=A0AB39I2Z9_9PSED|nr:long-chain fatty acid--CoA ligase [Pseudomonas sp. Hg5Tf]MDH2561890.1 long-chain fatty acid--CoA ligase [Pseudomonas sp. Hg5Tf]